MLAGAGAAAVVAGTIVAVSLTGGGDPNPSGLPTSQPSNPIASGSAFPTGPSPSLPTPSEVIPGEPIVREIDSAPGHRITVLLSNGTFGNTCCDLDVRVATPDDRDVHRQFLPGTGGYFETAVLNEEGTFRLEVIPQNPRGGNVDVDLRDSPPDLAIDAQLDGGPITVQTARGQNANLRFPMTAGHRLVMRLENSDYSEGCCDILVGAVGPQGENLLAAQLLPGRGGYADSFEAPVDGVYTLTLDPLGELEGAVDVTLLDSPPDVKLQAELGGPPVEFVAERPGQTASVSFEAPAGGPVELVFEGGTFPDPCCGILIIATSPSSVAVVAAQFIPGTETVVLSAPLTESGVYVLKVDPDGDLTGRISISVREP